MLHSPAALLAFKKPRPSPAEDFVCDWVTPAIPGKYASILKKRGDRLAAPDVLCKVLLLGVEFNLRHVGTITRCQIGFVTVQHGTLKNAYCNVAI